MTLTSDGGALTSEHLTGDPVQDSAHAYLGRFFARDANSQGDYHHVGGSISQVGNALRESVKLLCGLPPILGMTASPIRLDPLDPL